jgi:RND family efflux transporter MFP subunit
LRNWKKRWVLRWIERAYMKLRRSRILQMCLAVGFCAAALAGCSNKAADDADAKSVAAKAEVTVTRIARMDISQTVSLAGTATAMPNQDVRVSALVAGRIAELSVAEGDAVKAGQVVARLDNHTYRDQLRQSEAALEQAKANLENARLALARNDDLFKRGIVARKDLEDARTQQSVAAAALQQAEAALEIARLQVTRSEIVSPLNGAVAKRFVSVGEQVDGTAAQPIVEIANLREVEFLANCPATYLSKLHAGEAVNVTTEAAAGQEFAGRVVAISPAVDPATGVGAVRIRVPNRGGVLRMGMFLSAEIAVDTHKNALTVPPEAVYRDEAGQPRIFLINQDTANAVPVKLGIETKDRVELADANGVKEGESIILTGGYGLEDKAKVQTKPQSNQ